MNCRSSWFSSYEDREYLCVHPRKPASPENLSRNLHTVAAGPETLEKASLFAAFHHQAMQATSASIGLY